jgi:hypothetical protein
MWAYRYSILVKLFFLKKTLARFFRLVEELCKARKNRKTFKTQSEVYKYVCFSSCDDIEQSLIMSPGMVLLLFVAYLCIFIVGLVGNIMVMVVVLTRQAQHKLLLSLVKLCLSPSCLRLFIHNPSLKYPLSKTLLAKSYFG